MNNVKELGLHPTKLRCCTRVVLLYCFLCISFVIATLLSNEFVCNIVFLFFLKNIVGF